MAYTIEDAAGDSWQVLSFLTQEKDTPMDVLRAMKQVDRYFHDKWLEMQRTKMIVRRGNEQ